MEFKPCSAATRRLSQLEKRVCWMAATLIRCVRSVSCLRTLIVCCCVLGISELVAADANSTQSPNSASNSLNAGGTFFGRIPDPKRTHHYYIAAESELWDYAPEGQDV